MAYGSKIGKVPAGTRRGASERERICAGMMDGNLRFVGRYNAHAYTSFYAESLICGILGADPKDVRFVDGTFRRSDGFSEFPVYEWDVVIFSLRLPDGKGHMYYRAQRFEDFEPLMLCEGPDVTLEELHG